MLTVLENKQFRPEKSFEHCNGNYSYDLLNIIQLSVSDCNLLWDRKGIHGTCTTYSLIMTYIQY